jgi:hypothetical protein
MTAALSKALSARLTHLSTLIPCDRSSRPCLSVCLTAAAAAVLFVTVIVFRT